MKQSVKWLATALTTVSGFVAVSPVQAQYVTGGQYLSSMNPLTLNTSPNAVYAAWSGATFTSLPTGLEVNSPAAYGSLYYVMPNGQIQTLDPSDTIARFTFTVNGDPSAFIWIGTPFILNDNTGAQSYGGYSGYGNGGNPPEVSWNGNVVTWSVPLSPAQLAAVQTGTDAIYAFNLQLDPAVLAAGSYDVTFNSLQITSVPEPTTAALIGLGAFGLVASRRRR